MDPVAARLPATRSWREIASPASRFPRRTADGSVPGGFAFILRCRTLRGAIVRKTNLAKRALLIVLAWMAAMAASADTDVFATRLVQAARERTTHHETYDSAYRRIAYPMGDVADDRGVCSDVVIRAYRKLGIDLQALVHEDMRRNFNSYPRTWNLARPDTNIDHRRVPNLETFFRRAGAKLAVNLDPAQYQPGDLVTWRLPGNLPHIGVVSDRFARGTRRPLVIHNIGRGPVEDDNLFSYSISGHYRYRPQMPNGR